MDSWRMNSNHASRLLRRMMKSSLVKPSANIKSIENAISSASASLDSSPSISALS